MKRSQIVLLVIVVVLGLLGVAAVSILHDGLSARAEPSALETAIARAARKTAARKCSVKPVFTLPTTARSAMATMAAAIP
jgi:hypothetical protein